MNDSSGSTTQEAYRRCIISREGRNKGYRC